MRECSFDPMAMSVTRVLPSSSHSRFNMTGVEVLNCNALCSWRVQCEVLWVRTLAIVNLVDNAPNFCDVDTD